MPPRTTRIVRARFAGDALRVTPAPGPPITTAVLDGPRAQVAGAVDGDTVEFPLLAALWGEPDLALPPGDYLLALTGPDGPIEVAPTGPSLQHASDRYRASLSGAVLSIGPPPVSTRPGRTIRHQLGRRRLAEAVYFESFYGRTTGDNPAALDRAIAASHPHLTRYWSVADRSVAVPAGAVPVVERSEQWWQVRATARLLIVNDWLRWTYRQRPGQRVLQTWHGTPLKRLALDRAGRSARERLATRLQSRQWDALLAQNDYGAHRLREAYGYRGPVWVTGYPRTDVLHDTGRAATVRARLALAPEERAVLWVPTWRDDGTHLAEHLDPAALAGRLPGTRLLVRGHSRTLGAGRDIGGERVLDVTSYPDLADLLLVADVLVTDYSSVMFDFAVTGRPMVFHVPDLDRYRDVLRGFYFDPTGVVPGPVTRTPGELVAALEGLEPDRYAGRYAAWRERFVPLDDGHATNRVVQQLAEQGWLGPARPSG